MNFNSSSYVLLFSVSRSRNPCFVPLLTPLGSTFNKRCCCYSPRCSAPRLCYKAFVRPKTGVLYDGVIPSNLIGFQIATIKLRSGS
ncbi:hypothetical protein GQ457_03G001830 [Hibiscus cannabinus]